MSELAQLTKLFQGLGAASTQAESMARQLVKRADQLVAGRGQTREEAMAYLLRLVVQGHSGEAPKEFPSGTPRPPDAVQNRTSSPAK